VEENDASCGAWEWLNYKEALILEAKYPLLFCVCVCSFFANLLSREECPIVNGD
jgi:hypothetical protein